MTETRQILKKICDNAIDTKYLNIRNKTTYWSILIIMLIFIIYLYVWNQTEIKENKWCKNKNYCKSILRWITIIAGVICQLFLIYLIYETWCKHM